MMESSNVQEMRERLMGLQGVRTTQPTYVPPQNPIHSTSSVAAPVPVSQPVTIPNGQGVPGPFWSTSLTDCTQDEESCWWGTWCCCLLAARTSETFALDSAQNQVRYIILLSVVAFILLQLGLGGMGILLVIVGLTILTFRRAAFRVGIRQQLSISGSYFADFLTHFCMSCCAVCQEAREAKLRDMPKLDFCSGQKLAELELQRDDEQPVLSTQQLYLKLSEASQLILKLCAGFFAYISVRLLIAKPASFGMLLLIFVQPVAILYYFYWRSRRHNAQLDYVVKLFSVGFFMATTQSMVFEVVLQFVITLAAGVVFFLLNGNPTASANMLSQGVLNSSAALSSFMAFIERFSTQYHILDYSPQREALLSLSGHYSIDANVNLFDTIAVLQDDNSSPDDSSNSTGWSKSMLRQNMWLLLIVLFLFAFVVAAGVEETMKYFTVRCCRFPAALKDPQAILVYLMAGALGFATAENIEYVFGTKTSPIHGTSLFVGELLVLAMRICMPIHLICSVLQAANLSKVLLGGHDMNIIYVLLPALVLHGGFDFFLFAAGAIQYAYDLNALAFGVFTFIFPFLITVAGIVYAKREFDSVTRLFQLNWQPLQQDEDISVHNGILSATV